MKVETLNSLITVGILSTATLILSRSAFTFGARRKIGERDNWTCQGLDGNECLLTEENNGKPARFQDGYMVCAAHLPTQHQNDDTDTTHGRILCIPDHAAEELKRGNKMGAIKQLRMGVYNIHHVQETGEQKILTLDELANMVKRR